jgi:hypothetical protein
MFGAKFAQFHSSHPPQLRFQISSATEIRKISRDAIVLRAKSWEKINMVSILS